MPSWSCFIMQILLFNQLSTTYWQQKCCGRGKECWYYSITLNKPLMPVWKTFHKLFLGSTSRLICCIPSITRANPNPLWSFSETRETMSHLKSSRFCLCGHETLADEVGVGIGANQVESLLEVRKFGLPVRDWHLIWIEMFKHERRKIQHSLIPAWYTMVGSVTKSPG